MNEAALKQFLNDPAWDSPFFKRLAPNDTANAPTHQGGVFIPKCLRCFFPTLDETNISSASPTVDRMITAEMFTGEKQVGYASVRYQFQTWKGTRTPEARITGRLGPIRKLAHGGDLLIIQRSRDSLDAFRFLLLQKNDAVFSSINTITLGANSGTLFPKRRPISQDEFLEAKKQLLADAQNPFIPIRTDIPRNRSTRQSIARKTAFKETLLFQYRRRCAVSDISLTANTAAEVQAAHVIALSRGGADDPRNGITLTSTLHWAFDNGLFGIGENRCVIIPKRVLSMPANAWLVQFNGKQISEAKTPALRTSNEAFSWHRENLLTQWE